MEIKTYTYDLAGKAQLEQEEKGLNWPVVYMLYNDTTIYIGEATSAGRRMGQHLNNLRKQSENLQYIKVIFDDTFNKSVVLDYEQRLIKYFKVDGKFNRVLNANSGQDAAHNYYQKTVYTDRFRDLWVELLNCNMVTKPIDVIQNDKLFEFSPYTTLTVEQERAEVSIINDLIDRLTANEKGVSLVNGCSGTGKTIVGVHLINVLVNAINIDETELSNEQKEEPLNAAMLRVKWFHQHVRPIKVGFVFPMTTLRTTIENVFKENSNSLSRTMVLRPSDVIEQQYDVLVVDESHRLARRQGIQNYDSFDKACAKLGLDKFTSNELDWVLLSSKYTVLFYDKNQIIKSADIPYNDFQNSLNNSSGIINNVELKTQMRCSGGNTYINYLKDIFDCNNPQFTNIDNYEFRIFDDVDRMIQKLRDMDGEDNNLCKTVAGFAWKWNTYQGKKKIPNNLDKYNELVNNGQFDIEIQGHQYIWNISRNDWIRRKDSRYTIGCIHTSQGFDLNYVGVIFGKEIDYDPIENCIIVTLSKFKDRKAKEKCSEDEVKDFIINTYVTIMARGIKGCYVYACNHNLQEYLKRFIRRAELY